MVCCARQPAAAPHPLSAAGPHPLITCPHHSPPPLPAQVYGLHPKSASRRINVVGSLSSAEVVVPDVNAGCPAVVHVIDNVLLPDLAEEEAEVEVEGQEASGMFGSLLKLWGGM